MSEAKTARTFVVAATSVERYVTRVATCPGKQHSSGRPPERRNWPTEVLGLASVGNFRRDPSTSQFTPTTCVDFTFDQVAYLNGGNNLNGGNRSNFQLVPLGAGNTISGSANVTAGTYQRRPGRGPGWVRTAGWGSLRARRSPTTRLRLRFRYSTSSTRSGGTSYRGEARKGLAPVSRSAYVRVARLPVVYGDTFRLEVATLLLTS